jgi:hypothetical protein
MLFLCGTACLSAVYYVDTEGGNDDNTGISRIVAWRHIPGSCSTDNRSMVRGRGWSVLGPGDAVIIKGGSVIENRIVIDRHFYRDGRREAPIRLARDPLWGSGPVTFDGSHRQLGRWDPMILIDGRAFIEIDGGGPGGFVVRDVRGRGLVAVGNSEGGKMLGLLLRDMKFTGNSSHNVVIQRQESFLLENVEVDGGSLPDSGGFYIGGKGFACSRGRLVNCVSPHNGSHPGRQMGGTDLRMGFWLQNSTDVVYDRCAAHDNEGRGWDAGSKNTLGRPFSTVTDGIVYLNCVASRNSFGFGATFDDLRQGGTYWYLNCIAHDNSMGGWTAYGGATVNIYNCVSSRNGSGFYLDTMIPWNHPPTWSRQTTVAIRNTIVAGNRLNALYAHDCRFLVFTGDHNLYEQAEGGGTLVRWCDAPGNEQRQRSYRFSAADFAAWRAERQQDAHSICIGAKNEPSRTKRTAANVGAQEGSHTKAAGANLTLDWPPGISTAGKSGNARPPTGPWDIGAY